MSAAEVPSIHDATLLQKAVPSASDPVDRQSAHASRADLFGTEPLPDITAAEADGPRLRTRPHNSRQPPVRLGWDCYQP